MTTTADPAPALPARYRRVADLPAAVLAETAACRIGPVPWNANFRTELRAADGRLLAFVGQYRSYRAARCDLAEYCLTPRER